MRDTLAGWLWFSRLNLGACDDAPHIDGAWCRWYGSDHPSFERYLWRWRDDDAGLDCTQCSDVLHVRISNNGAAQSDTHVARAANARLDRESGCNPQAVVVRNTPKLVVWEAGVDWRD